MPELTHDAEDGFHEIQLSAKQLVFLFMLTTAVSVAIFLCGVLVGRGVRAERGDEESTVAAAPQAAPAGSAAVTSAEPPTPPAEETLTYDERLRRQGAPAEQLKKNADVQVESPPPPAAQPPAPQTAAPQATPAALRADVPTSPQPGNWVIQVHALQNRDAASRLVRSLTSKRYPAFLMSPASGSPQIYRVQIGAYRDRAEAEQVASRLAKEEQFKPDIKRR